jgi:DNA-binding NarL/FixJ family response regulator
VGENHAKQPRLRVAVVDGYPIAREGLRSFLSAAPGMAVAGEADDGHAAVRLIRATVPQLVILGFELARGTDGVDVCRSIKGDR